MKTCIAAFFMLMPAGYGAAQAIRSIPERLDSLLHTFYRDKEPGASVAVWQSDSLLFEKSYGIADIATKEKITSQTSFNIASLTKQFTAIAILQLYENGKFLLSDKIGRFFPDMEKTVADVVSVQQLLTHSSGIYDHYRYVDTAGLTHAHDADVYTAIRKLDSLYFAPDTKFRYSNTGYALLGLIIERVSGLSYADYLKKFVFTPAGMRNTAVWSEKERIPHAATGYDRKDERGVFVPSGPDENVFFSTEGDGGIYTSIHDYLLWLQALQEGKVFSRTIVDKARSTEFFVRPEDRLGYGFGWFTDDSAEPGTVSHSGSNGGFRSYSFTMPQTGFAIVLFSNRSDIDVEEVVSRMYGIVYPGKKPVARIEKLTR